MLDIDVDFEYTLAIGCTYGHGMFLLDVRFGHFRFHIQDAA
jgi:hypothetical protein